MPELQSIVVVQIPTEEGPVHEVTLAPGDHVPPGLLEEAIGVVLQVSDAAWSGSEVGMTWVEGGDVLFLAAPAS